MLGNQVGILEFITLLAMRFLEADGLGRKILLPLLCQYADEYGTVYSA